ncbi:MAG: alpha/beta hydrolase, partial [Halocynthiibacter sp.]
KERTTMTTITDPEVLSFIAQSEAAYPPEMKTASIDKNRAFYAKMCASFEAPFPTGVTYDDITIDTIPVRRYRRQNTPKARLLYIHGGGFVLGDVDSHHGICGDIADRTEVEVWALTYRLCPEHPYPAALNDCDAVWHAMGSDRPRLIAGDSAGATLSAALTHRFSRLGKPQPHAQILIYPTLGGDRSLPSYTQNANAPLLSTADMDYYEGLYNAPANDPEGRPLSAAHYKGLPPTFITTADMDPLRDDGAVYAQRLKAAGTPVIYRNEAQLPHAHLRARHVCTRAKESFDAVISYINQQVD